MVVQFILYESDTDTNLKKLPCLGEFDKIASQVLQEQDPIPLIFQRLLQLSSFVAADLLLSSASYCITGNGILYFQRLKYGCSGVPPETNSVAGRPRTKIS